MTRPPTPRLPGSARTVVSYPSLGGNTSSNVLRQLSTGYRTALAYDARELAMTRMQAEAEELEAEGIVGVQLLSLPHQWGGPTPTSPR